MDISTSRLHDREGYVISRQAPMSPELTARTKIAITAARPAAMNFSVWLGLKWSIPIVLLSWIVAMTGTQTILREKSIDKDIKTINMSI
jgi:hypothetical protein